MNINTSELIGNALDWAVVKAEGRFGTDLSRGVLYFEGSGIECNYSTNDTLGFEIIVEYNISTVFQKSENQWFASIANFGPHHKAGRNYGEGKTRLIAAMRAFVSFKLGEQVDIPESLLPRPKVNAG